ncbi:NAD(P)/FAD-dependent oxidoreductase [Parasphingopyxis marina]|uniref:FAD-dependent monooxygenase n=1 Tax=Parasphingopyxis marina TaxID=2761622 RepID=A0A842HXN2_9SPHN|nr:FAD-dependent monooxygenase [Parasphingopyxis marina]MBC2776264.1 FAD-dependent monooxygenase [Parasphingopyxis marina]
MRRTAALIVGGGPAGAAAAITLARGGAAALVVERDAETRDHLCGGFVSWRTLETLARLGLSAPKIGGYGIDRVRLFAGNRAARARLPSPGIGVSRRRLDELLLGEAEAAGAEVIRGMAVREALPGAARLADDSEIAAEALFLATGKYELRGAKRAASPAQWMGLRYRYAATPSLAEALAGTIELHFFEGGYAGLLLQEDGTANLCMAVRRERLAEAGSDPGAMLDRLAAETPSLAERLGRAGDLVAHDAVGLVPYGWCARQGEAGLFRIGDQAAVIPSLAGEGIGIAIASGILAARAYAQGGPAAAPAYQRAFARRARRPLAVAGRLMRMAESPRAAGPAMRLAQIPGLVALLGRLTRIAA